MPAIDLFFCDNEACEFAGPAGWGYYMYAIADDGERVVCPHPSEKGHAREVVGLDATNEELDERTGFNYYCVCIDCAGIFERDPNRDELVCPDCGSRAVTLMVELVGSPCPSCGNGTFVREDSGGIA